jgi:hypothetical protein
MNRSSSSLGSPDDIAGTKRLIVVAIALGVLVLVFVPVHTLVRADARVLADDDYVEPACRFPFPVIPEPICPRFVAGESPLTLIYVLIGVPLLARGARPGPLLVLSVATAGLAGLQLAAPAAFTFSPADGGPRPSPFEADPGCGLVACGLDHTIFHLVQVPFLTALTIASYRLYRTSSTAA